MSGLTTDLRTRESPRCEATYGTHACGLAADHDGAHVETRIQESEWSGNVLTARWKMPMTPRREARPPLTLDEIIYHIGPAHVSYERGPGGVPTVFIHDRPFREVT